MKETKVSNCYLDKCCFNNNRKCKSEAITIGSDGYCMAFKEKANKGGKVMTRDAFTICEKTPKHGPHKKKIVT